MDSFESLTVLFRIASTGIESVIDAINTESTTIVQSSRLQRSGRTAVSRGRRVVSELVRSGVTTLPSTAERCIPIRLAYNPAQQHVPALSSAGMHRNKKILLTMLLTRLAAQTYIHEHMFGRRALLLQGVDYECV